MIVICGPCVIEDDDTMMRTAEEIIDTIAQFEGIEFYFKSSCIKDNRTKLENDYGPGMDRGLKLLKKIGKKFGVKITTDFHNPFQIDQFGNEVDLIQIPAYLGMQTSLVMSATKGSDKPIHFKKPQFLSPERINQIVGKVYQLDPNRKIFISERGMSYGFDFLIVDPRTIRLMRRRIETEYSSYVKLLVDVTHPNKYWNDYTYCYDLTKMAMAVGSDGIFVECHSNPTSAKCDSDSQLPTKELKSLLRVAKVIRDAQNE
jgi:2-dehydro-3-deoxyphosphooctonate aldolase (KDO 8-P synthase)